MSGSTLAEELAGPAPRLDRALLLVSAVISDRDDASDVGETLLTELASAAPDDLPGLVEYLFGIHGFHGDVDDYHALDNSLFDRVLERRRGMPITLASVLICVGQRVGIELHGIGLPGHFMVGVAGDGDQFVDPFAGAIVGRAAVADRLRSMLGPGAELTDDLLQPVDTVLTVRRVCNNLTNTVLTRDRSRLDRLLDVRLALPPHPRDDRVLRDLAQTRARWDIIAELDARLLPDGSDVGHLWARLN